MSQLDDLVRQVTRLQRQIDNLVKPEVPMTTWQTWTPVLTQSGTVTADINIAKYLVVGDTVDVYCDLRVTGTGTANFEIEVSGFSLAANVPSGAMQSVIGWGHVRDASVSTSYYGFVVVATSPTVWRIMDSNTRGIIGNNPSFGLASNDRVMVRCRYEKT